MPAGDLGNIVVILLPGGTIDVIDRPGRLLGLIYGDLAQMAQLAAEADALTPVNSLLTSSYGHVFNGATWDRVREGAQAGSALVDDINSQPLDAIYNNVVTTTATNAVQLVPAGQACSSVTVKALDTNTGLVYVGNATVAAANGFRLDASESVSLDVSNLNLVYIDVAVDNEGVSFIAAG